MYNCHGLTFASRRTCISNPATLQTILHEDQYDEISLSDVVAGDVAVYFGQKGDIEHSGIVMSKEQFGTRILSKWGRAHEVVHMVADCPYDASNVKYFRVCK